MTGEPDLISLLHRADWTRLSLSAEVNDGSRVLIARGRRYRRQTGEYVTGCDGGRAWEQPGPENDANVHWGSGPEPPLRRLFCPAWLLPSSRLETRGRVRACGRDALHVVVTRRPGTGRGVLPPLRPDRVEAIVDAELGILLRIEGMAAPHTPDVIELVSLETGPVTDPVQFSAPPGSRIGETFGEALSVGGPVWNGWKTAAGLAAGGLGAWIRYSPFGRGKHPAPGRDDAEAQMPPADPAPGLSEPGRPSGPPVSDELLHVLHDSGTNAFAATLHQWLDVGALLSQVPEGARRAGFGGLGLLLGAIGERPSACHAVSAVRVGGPGQYQIDHVDEPPRGPTTIACDGQRRWQVYPGRVTVGPAQPPPEELADVADASWLLECRLSGGEPVIAGGRPAYRISVVRGDALFSPLQMFPAAVAVVDAELGILLQLTFYLGGRPVMRYELRDIAGAGDFRAEIPPGLPVVEEGPFERARYGGSAPSASVVLDAASTVARQVATQVAKAARNFLRRMDTR